MSWLEVRAIFASPPPDLSPLIDAYARHGAENTMEEPDGLTGCLPAVEGVRAAADRLREELLALGVDAVRERPVADEDWHEVWRRFFRPRRVGRRFLVSPSWEDAPAAPDDLALVLDPGQAFGTGDHPTTRLCLELLEEAPVEGRSVADVGCGSGILAIAARRLGAAHVVAIDIDPLCAEVARENAARNQVEIEAVAGQGLRALPDWGRGRFDVVASNIISATLVRIAPDVARALRAPGVWILSGVLEANWGDVRAAAEAQGFVLRNSCHEDGWLAARFDLAESP